MQHMPYGGQAIPGFDGKAQFPLPVDSLMVCTGHILGLGFQPGIFDVQQHHLGRA
jgi:hypothetical protein